MISIENVTFGYNRYHNVLKDFSLQFKLGGIYGLLGKNGTGKSTLLYLIAGLLTPGKGEVRVDGALSQQRLPGTMQDLFIVPEEYDLPRITLRQYVESLKPFYPRFSDELLVRCLEGFDMSPEVDLGALSMGQKKKVYMCIALATNTRYLLMDEPTNGLDILSKSQFRKVVIQGMSEEKTIIISTHQVHDVEHLLDHVCIVDNNRVLLDAPITEDEGPVDLEKLFLDVQSGTYVPSPAQEAQTEAAAPAPEERKSPLDWWHSLLAVARWDTTVNRKFYIRQMVVITCCVLVPIMYKYLMLLGNFHFFNAAGVGAMMAAEQDVIAASYYFGTVFAVAMVQMFCYMFHGLTTKQGRINELTLPATNAVRFAWHVLLCTVGTTLVFYAGVVIADLMHVLLGWAMLGQREFQSLTLATWKVVNVINFIDIDTNIFLQMFGWLMSMSFLSTFALGSAWKYRHTFGYVLVYHIGLWLSAMFMLGFLAQGFVALVEHVDNFNAVTPLAVNIAFNLFAGAVFAAIWYFTYRLYCRAQITTRRNP